MATGGHEVKQLNSKEYDWGLVASKSAQLTQTSGWSYMLSASNQISSNLLPIYARAYIMTFHLHSQLAIDAFFRELGYAAY